MFQSVTSKGKALYENIIIQTNTEFRGVGRNFTGGVPVPGNRSQMRGSGGIAPLLKICFNTIHTLILYDTLDSLQHVLMARCFPDSKLLQVFSIDFYFISDIVGIWKVKKNCA